MLMFSKRETPPRSLQTLPSNLCRPSICIQLNHSERPDRPCVFFPTRTELQHQQPPHAASVTREVTWLSALTGT